MPALDNPRHERFAQELATTELTSAEAYRKVFGTRKGSATDVSASRLKAKCSLRIEEIRGEYAKYRASQDAAGLKKRFLTLDRKREILAEIVETPIGDVDERSLLAQSVEYKTTPGSRDREGYETIKIKMPDKIRAIELDAKLAGEFEEKVKLSGEIEHTHTFTDEQRQSLMAKKRLAMEQRGQKFQPSKS